MCVRVCACVVGVAYNSTTHLVFAYCFVQRENANTRTWLVFLSLMDCFGIG